MPDDAILVAAQEYFGRGGAPKQVLFFFSPFLSCPLLSGPWLSSGAGPIALRPWLVGSLVLFSVRRAPRSHTHTPLPYGNLHTILSLRVSTMCVSVSFFPSRTSSELSSPDKLWGDRGEGVGIRGGPCRSVCQSVSQSPRPCLSRRAGWQ